MCCERSMVAQKMGSSEIASARRRLSGAGIQA
jgi:hypothetical protein